MSIGIIRPNADLFYRLRRLGTAGAVLQIGTHPDDEEPGMLAFASRGLSVRAVYWSATRGEGGQNRIGSDRGEALGITRTWESLDAREIDGGEVLYGPFYDFGFSKTAQSAFDAWDRNAVVKEIVRAIRLVQPQVIVSRWSGDPSDGHGQHQAIGAAVAEAFEAASDPGRFPETGPPWRALKLYRSTTPDWQPGENQELGKARPEQPEQEAAELLCVDTGALDPVAGRTYQEQAAIGINRHRTQAMGFIPEPGEFLLYYRLERSLVPAPDRETGLFDGLDPTLTGIVDVHGAAEEPIRDALVRAQRCAEAAAGRYHPARSAEIATDVLEGLEHVRVAREALGQAGLGEQHRRARDAMLARKAREFEEVAAQALGLRLECLLESARVTPGERVGTRMRLWTLGPMLVEVLGHTLSVPEGWRVEHARQTVGPGDASRPRLEAEATIDVPSDALPTTPYWLREPRTRSCYTWPASGPLSLPFDPPLVEATCELSVNGHRLTVRAPGVRREPFPGGFRELPLAVLPQVALHLKERRVLLPGGSRAGRLRLGVEAQCIAPGGAKTTLRVRVPEGWSVDPEQIDLVFTARGETHTVSFEVSIPRGAHTGAYPLVYEMESGDRRPGLVVKPVRRAAPGLPGEAGEDTCVAEVFLIEPASVSVHLIDAEFATTLRYGYVAGADEEIVPALSRFGLDLHVLSDSELMYEELSAYQAIVVGPNAYLVRDSVRRAAARLLDYAEAGGTMIVQHQGYGYEADGFAPYPFRFHRPHDRVTSADGPVTVLEPDHPLMHVPNEITAGDFDDWFHDRGMYFFGEWDHRYEPILACADPGEELLSGGLLVAPVGRGTYVYCGYSLFRQVPAGVPGACRLLANLLGLAEGRLRERAARMRSIPILAGLADDELREVARIASERWLSPGEMLAHQGDRGRELYLVYEGQVEALKGEQVVFVAGPGDVIGELSVLADTPRSAALRALEGAKLLAVPRDGFRELLSRSPEIAERMLSMLADRLAHPEGSP